MTTLVVIAKETLPGRVKTRLHPAFSLEQAAMLAAAAVADTLAAVATLHADRRVLLFDGTVLPEDSAGWEVLDQADGTLDQRLGAMFDAVHGPTVVIGMDTPQLDAADLEPVFEPWPDGVDAWFGPATDGGFWALGLADPEDDRRRGDLLRGVPMSRDDTGDRQLDRLRDAGLGVRMLPALLDVDTIEDARDVAALAPTTRFAETFRTLQAGLS